MEGLFIEKPFIKLMYIKVTNQCNLKCPFCYVNKDNPTIIDPHVAIDYIKCLQPHRIVFHGGEPLLYPEIIQQILPSCHCSLSITSNLSFKLNEKQFNILSQFEEMATSYSIDREENNNFYNTLKSNIRLVKKAGIFVTLLVTLSKQQLKQSPQILAQKIMDLAPDNVLFERLICSPGYIDHQLARDTDEYLSQLFDLIPHHMNVLEDVMLNAIKKNTSMFDNTCMNTVRTLNADGSLQICPSISNEQLNSLVMKRQECLECKYYKYCKSDCLSFKNQCNFPFKTFQKVKQYYAST